MRPINLTAIACIGLVACGPMDSPLQESKSAADARARGTRLGEQLRLLDGNRDGANTPRLYRYLVFAAHATANAQSAEEHVAMAKALIAEGSAHGFDGLESSILMYLDSIVRAGNAQTIKTIVASLGSINYNHAPAQFPQPIGRIGTGYIPSMDPAAIRGILDAAAKIDAGEYLDGPLDCATSTPDETGATMSTPNHPANGASRPMGGFEVWLANSSLRDKLCNGPTLGATTPSGRRIRLTDYCRHGNTASVPCGDIASEGLLGLSVDSCANPGWEGEDVSKRSDLQDAQQACTASMIERMEGGGDPAAGDDGGTSGAGGACSEPPACNGGGDSGGSHSGDNGGSGSDSGDTGKKDSGNGHPSTPPPRPSDAGFMPISNGPVTMIQVPPGAEGSIHIEIKNYFGTQSVQIVTGNNNDVQVAPDPSGGKGGGFAGGLWDAAKTAVELWAKASKKPIDNDTLTQTKECADFFNKLGDVLERAKVDVMMQPGRMGDPRTVYPTPDATAADAMHEVEACAGDNDSFGHNNSCGVTDCNFDYLAVGTSANGCCEPAAANSDYQRVSIAAETGCRAVINCGGDDTTCCEGPPSAPGPMPGNPRPVSIGRKALGHRFFVGAWDARRMDPAAGSIAGMERVLLP